MHMIINAEDNVFVVGQFRNCDGGNPYNPYDHPSRIDNDTILSNTPDQCQTLFMAKFSSEGDMLSFNLPQEPGPSTTVTSKTINIDFQSDQEGNMYWFLFLPSGSYENGTFNLDVNDVEGQDRFHIFKYNPQGEFVEAITPDIEVEVYTAWGWDGFNFAVSPYNKHFYFYLHRVIPETQTIIFGGQQATKAFVIASYDEQGNFLWMRENNSTEWSPKIYNLAFDEENNIYLGGKSSANQELLGFATDAPGIANFVMKTDSTFENLIWASQASISASEEGALLLYKDELIYTGWGYGEDFTWGDQSHYFNPHGTLTDVLFARFDIETGACLEINNIVSDDGFQEIGTALAVDSAGDYLVGGQFNYNLFDDFGNVVYNIGAGQTDFFIAKYATQACNEPMSVEQMETVTFKVYPNPVKERLYVSNLQTSTTYSLYTINGSLVSSGQLDPAQNSLSTHALNSGLYFLKLQDQKGRTQVVKVVKE